MTKTLMTNTRQSPIDKVRASRDGHEFHEAWTARKALQLVMPTDELVGIAVEGLAPIDQADASAQAVEIADLVLYYGDGPTFSQAGSVVIVQVKYSKRSRSVPYRISDAKKTIRKFATAFRSLKRKHGAKEVEKKLTFELITNRPVAREFREAIDSMAAGEQPKANAKKQATQFAVACGFKEKELAQFARKVKITGLAGNLRQNKQRLSRVLADWSVAPDAIARARLGNLRQLLRDKAGLAGEGQNVITRTDVLDALELQSAGDLLPCPTSFPEVGHVVKREQLSTVVDRIPKLDKPFLIHADGGVGKTVFLQSLAAILSETHETILFDCFGGGAYRAPEDARHLPKRGLIHIINSLACKGLCDPLLPINENVEELVKAFRTRLAQAVATLQSGSRGKQLLLFIDAIDNAAEHAKDKAEPAFPTLLLESFHHNGPVEGVRLIVSCRTYRREISKGDIPCEEFKLNPFSLAETARYLSDRIPTLTDTQIQVAYSRSEGNPRILEHLALSDRGLLEPSEINKVIKLDDLLKERIQNALGEALKRGYKKSEIDAFLAGLAILPPPVPLDEYADAHAIDLSAVKSFATDLAPLLEQTRHGLMFRDEPTETLVREEYTAKAKTLRTLADNLFNKQGVSVYAASALPGLLQRLNDGKRLFNLAFDERFPTTITSTVGKQNIRYARLKAAVLHAAQNEDFNRLVHLLVELSTIAAVSQRGAEYLLNNPDLVVASQDVDATRRLFETHTRWPGTRYARLTIASLLSGDLSDAYRHVVNASEWIHHFYLQNDEYRRDRGGPERLDIATIPVCLVAQDQGQDAAQFMKRWRDWYAYEIAEHIFTLLYQAERMETVPTANIRRFLDSLKLQPGVLAAALSFIELDNAAHRRLIRELAESCKKKKTIEKSESFLHKRDSVQDGLLKATAIAVAMKMRTEAAEIVETISSERPNLLPFIDRFSIMDPFSTMEVFSFVAYTALRAAVMCQPLTEHTLLPQELVDIGARIPKRTKGEAFRKALKKELEEQFKAQQKLPDKKKPVHYEAKREADRFINERLETLFAMAEAFRALISSSLGNGDNPFLALVGLWAKFKTQQNHPPDFFDVPKGNPFFDLLGRQLLIFAIWARSDLKPSSVEAFITKVRAADTTPVPTLIRITTILAKRPDLQELAGQVAMSVKPLIEHEDEVNRRASLFAQLSRAIMPASVEESASYFRLGLEQMDAIGSGDYEFTNEMLLYASELRGHELEESDFHTLSNICELNIYEQDKFPWLMFARGLARTSGCRSLAKLGRWDDRDKSSLDYTLLPYLMALIEQDKIDPAVALGLLRLSVPVELHVSGTKHLAELICKKQYPNSKALLTELILQFEQNHPGVFMPSILETLYKIAERELDKDSDLMAYLSIAAPKFEKLRSEENENRNYRGTQYLRSANGASDQDRKNRLAIKKIENETNPADETSIAQVIDALNKLSHNYDLKIEFLENLQSKLKYGERSRYVQTVSRLESLDIYTKLRLLKECKKKWTDSSVSLQQVFRDIAEPLIQIHPYDFVGHDYLSGSKLKDITEISGISAPILALKLVAIFASPGSYLPASSWLGLAATICEKAKQGEGQTALKRLLNSNSAKLASTVVDGEWKNGLYPKSGETDIAAGLVWRTLGSPYAAHRWRAAHSIRCFARFGKWEVIDALLKRFHSTDAHPYQAPELPFYFLHARLWLLIALARVAIDHPQNTAKYADKIKVIAIDTNAPHVLMRHFAARILSACANAGSLVLSKRSANALNKINESPFPINKTEEYKDDSFYQQHSPSRAEPEFKFNLDYDFDQSDVGKVSDMFDRLRWETRDAITAWVRKYDPQIKSMYENGGRTVSQRDRLRGMTDRYHLYGQQLGWHALYLVAGEFLAKYPVLQRPYYDENPWHEWLRRESLTRADGLWLADGIDRPPVNAQVNLYDRGNGSLALTGDKAKILSLLNIEGAIGEEVVVAGDWHSVDGIEIDIWSALVPPHSAKSLALQLSEEDPFRVWLPRVEEGDYGGEYLLSEKEPYEPWVVWPHIQVRLDATDLLGVTTVAQRLYFTKAINEISELKPLDPFRRTWGDPRGRVAARSEAWGRNPAYYNEESISAKRLVCSSRFLKDVLTKRSAELLVFIRLRQREKEWDSSSSKYWHTTAAVTIDNSLDFKLYLGAINRPQIVK